MKSALISISAPISCIVIRQSSSTFHDLIYYLISSACG